MRSPPLNDSARLYNPPAMGLFDWLRRRGTSPAERPAPIPPAHDAAAQTTTAADDASPVVAAASPEIPSGSPSSDTADPIEHAIAAKSLAAARGALASVSSEADFARIAAAAASLEVAKHSLRHVHDAPLLADVAV